MLYIILAIFDSQIRIFRLITSAPMDIHLVRVPQDVDVVNAKWKPAKWGEHPAFFSVHVGSYASVVHTFEAVAGSRSTVGAPAVSRVTSGAPERNKNSKKNRWNDIWGRLFVNVVSLKYIGMIILYINVGELVKYASFRWTYTVNCSMAGVRQLRWQHLSPVVTTFPKSIRLLSSFFIKHCILPPLSLSFYPSVSLSLTLSLSFCGTPSRFPNELSFTEVWRCWCFLLQSKVLCS